MDQGLFAKHLRALHERDSVKERIIASIREKTGIDVVQTEITIEKKSVTFSTSSVKKMSLLQKGLKDILQTLGFTLLG